jgi:hypothetical protein
VGTRKRRKKRWGFGVVWSLDGSEGERATRKERNCVWNKGILTVPEEGQ